MEPAWALTAADRDRIRRPAPPDFILPSRDRARAVLRATVEDGAGIALLTGEPGAGKTWLWGRLQAEMPLPWRWAVADLSPALRPADLYRLVGRGMGLHESGDGATARLELEDYLRECSAEGQRWVLTLDESHNAADSVLEEVRVVANRLGQADGFAALILVGQTALLRRLARVPLSAIAARLAARVHLRPLDIEEAAGLVEALLAGRACDDATLDRIHRDAGGNPRRLLECALGAPPGRDARGAVEGPRHVESHAATPAVNAPSPAPVPADRDWDVPVLGPSKPPLRVGEGMIEVGWEPTEEAEQAPRPALLDSPAGPSRSAVVPAAGSAEAIEDHYAALQAWTEWAENQGRGPAERAARSDDGVPGLPEPVGPARADLPLTRTDHPNIWPDAQHDFAPYSQLFSRTRRREDSRQRDADDGPPASSQG